jgi:pyruvate dehydrogenase E1 component beta subunit
MPRRITYRDAIREALDEEIARDPMVVVMGEEVAQYNGAYKVTQGLWDKWGDKRLVDTPISEAGFIGMGIGASMLGVRPVMELMFWSFYTVAWDQIVNNGAMVRYMSGGKINVPHRHPRSGQWRHQRRCHPFSHTPENIMANFPGMKCVCPSNAYDAKGLMKAAIRDNDPVMFMESTKLYGEEWDVPSNDEIPGGDLFIPLGLADVKRVGTDISLIAHGKAVITCLEAARILEEEHGISAEVVDLRTIRPLDEDTILESVAKTHRAIYVEENKPYCGIGAQIAYMIQERIFDELDAPVQRVCSLDSPAIYSPPARGHFAASDA